MTGNSKGRRNTRKGEALADVPLLFGRDADIARLDQLIDNIGKGGWALTLCGEPGIGKTALLELVQLRARRSGFRVLDTLGEPAEAQLPFAALHKMLRPILKGIAALPPRQGSALLAAFGMADEASSPDMFLVALATLTLLTECAARRPILVTVDDAQWLDQPSYDVLTFVSRRLASDPIILLLTMRDGSSRLDGLPEASRHHLAGLDDAAAGQLLDANAPNLAPDLRRHFIREALGNPLALVELPGSERAAGAGDLAWLPLTQRLERAFSSRVSDLSDNTRMLLAIAAENDSTSLDEVLRAGTVLLGDHQTLDEIRPAIQSRLIGVEHTNVRFRHPLVRSAIHQSTDIATRQRIHAALASVIRDQPDRKILHEAAATIGANETLAVQLDQVAERAKRRGGLKAAIDAFESAARVSGTAKTRSARLLHAAELAADLGQPDLVNRLLRETDRIEQDPSTQARVGWIREMSEPPMVNDPAKIFALIGLAEQAKAVRANELAINLLWRAAQRCWWGNANSATRQRILAAAVKLGLKDSDPRLIAIAGYAGALEHGGAVYRRLQDLANKNISDPGITRILGSTANVIGAFDLGVTFLAQASAGSRDQGRLGDLPRVLFARAWAEMEVGAWMAAMRSAEEAARLGEETGETLWIAAAHTVLANLAGMRGNIQLFEEQVERAERLVVPAGASFLAALLQIARGITAIGAGRYIEAYEHLQRLFASADPASNVSIQFFALADYIEASVNCGLTNSARSVLREMEQQAGPAPVPWVQAMLCYGKALLSAPENAEQFFIDGLGPVAKGWPFLRGRLLLAYGTWLRRQRRSADARSPLRVARDLFDALGAAPWSDRARQELRASGESSRGRAALVLDALTPQEIHIAQLAASGPSNKEIGAKLYLSHRTVGYHLHKTFPKLGITSRARLRGIFQGMPPP